jgi:hypothetical protein
MAEKLATVKRGNYTTEYVVIEQPGHYPATFYRDAVDLAKLVSDGFEVIYQDVAGPVVPTVDAFDWEAPYPDEDDEPASQWQDSRDAAGL